MTSTTKMKRMGERGFPASNMPLPFPLMSILLITSTAMMRRKGKEDFLALDLVTLNRIYTG